MDGPRRILIRCPNPVGDAVMATPAMRALRVAHPQAEIVLMGPPQHEGLLRDVPHFDAYWPLRGRSLADLWRRSREVAARGFDWAVLLPDSPRTAVEAFLARIPRRAGYARDRLRRAMVTDPLPPPMENGRRVAISMIERYQRITRVLGVPDAGLACDLVVHDPSRERVAKQLAERGAGDAPLLLVTPGASFGPAKLWPVEYFAQACDEISRRHGLLPVILPAPNPEEEAIARDVARLTRERSLLAAPGSLEDLKAMVERCALLLTNDTGPRHVAVALDRPVVTLMGSTDPRHTNHLLERQRVLFEDVPCRPCHKPVCAIDHRCLRRLMPARVVQAAGELLHA
ncbi:MAG: lipopolysaccharide heptosyltransferase II [Myxococcota bacterium]